MIERAIGLMSGTSADGIDAAIALFDDGRFQGLEHCYTHQYPQALRARLIALGRDAQAATSLQEWATLDVAVGECFAAAAEGVLNIAGLKATEIAVVGSHGQTVFHDPRGARSSLQLGDPNVIAARTGLLVAADFRRMDMALGGEGAPLVPAFHQAVFAGPQAVTVVNIGGIANVTHLPGNGGVVTGFDCGPGNGLMDEWALATTGQAYDADGALAARGEVIPELLKAWLAAPYFALPAPKSTGRAQFNLPWAEQATTVPLSDFAAADVQATLCELTAQTIAAALLVNSSKVLVCGGGAANGYLMQRLTALAQARLGNTVPVQSTATLGLHPQWVEAAAFAWLGYQRLAGLAGNCPAVTGSTRFAVLGGLYDGRNPQELS